MEPSDLLLEKEIDVIVSSIYNVCVKQHIGYLKSPAFKWLIKCAGWKHEGNWSSFTEKWADVTAFQANLFLFRTANGGNTIYQSILTALENR